MHASLTADSKLIVGVSEHEWFCQGFNKENRAITVILHLMCVFVHYAVIVFKFK